jgi:hypothetical protein
MKDFKRKTFWIQTELKREEIDRKRASFNVRIESNIAQGYGHLEYKTRETDDLVSIDLVFNVPDLSRAGGTLQEIHGLPQAAANQIKKTGNPDCPLDLEFPAEIREV